MLGTYGKQLGEHRHRRNRPCTFPNYIESQQLCSELCNAMPTRRCVHELVRASAAPAMAEVLFDDGLVGEEAEVGIESYPLSMTRAATSSVARDEKSVWIPQIEMRRSRSDG